MYWSIKWVVVGVLAVGMFSGCASPQKTESFESMMGSVLSRKDLTSYKKVRAEFIRLAVARDTHGLLKKMELYGYNTDKLTTYFETEIFPFFAGFGEVTGPEIANIIKDSDGDPGYTLYGYVKNDQENEKPYAIAIVEKGGRLVVNNIIVGRCFEGLHPKCP
ncbi:MAG: hypothetical protein HYS19_01785 [Nitrosomonadales bacterium]|nr:hypothetical protein [Nitrosomonadales bacterium]